jgi:uncharacterized membrane protein YhaH (DUF805 family)
MRHPRPASGLSPPIILLVLVDWVTVMPSAFLTAIFWPVVLGLVSFSVFVAFDNTSCLDHMGVLSVMT